ncbi:hypothetical protein [Nocardia amikacinitolerans]|uniref:hypothetical protein n=1 Tax=Nocardia amikacinitolerans TaxID=756689 RepID=UPI0020A4B615|nr:hypothetical protein [Nocardia amikacinitolerans]MCP2287872.1 hypothetical protein [Nocardia amikacinitolerans]
MNCTATRPRSVTHPSGAGRRGRSAAGVFGVVLLAAAVGCGGADEPAGPDLAARPSGLRWQAYQGVALPHTDQGPESLADGAATGFEQSPPGAAVAAITHTVRLSVAADEQWPKVIAAEVVPGPARDEWAVSRVQLSITGPAEPEYAPRLLGYKITDYTEQRTAVDVYTEYSDGSKAVNHTVVEWFAEDWRLRLPDPDSTARPVEAIDVLPTDIVTLEAPK